MPSSDNQVTITLDLVGQKAAVAGIGDVAAALQDLQDTVTGTNDAVTASTDTMATETSASFEAVGSAATAAADQVDAANVQATDSLEAMAASTSEASDSIIASYERMAAAGAANLGTGKGVAGSASVASKGLMGTVMSMKTLVLTAGAAEALRSFSNYQTALTRLGTMAGATASQIAAVNTQIGKTHTTLAQSPTALATAYYNPMSEFHSVPASNAIEAAAAKLADISGAPLTGTTGTSYAVTTMLQTLGLKPTAANVSKVAGLINGTVGAGDMSLQDLLSANSTGYFNTTEAYKIPDQSAAGYLAFMTSQGVPAQNAATRSRMLFSLLAAPSAQADKYLTQLGLTTADVSGTQGQLAALGLNTTTMASLLEQPNGIVKAMQAVEQKTSGAGWSTPETVALFSKIFGGGRSDATALTLAQHLGLATQFTNNVGTMSSPQQFATDWQKYTQTLSYSTGQLKSEFDEAAIEVGKDLVPAFKGLVMVLGPLLKLASTNIGAMVVAGGLIGGLVKTLAKAASLFGGGRAAAGIGAGEDAGIGLGGLGDIGAPVVGATIGAAALARLVNSGETATNSRGALGVSGGLPGNLQTIDWAALNGHASGGLITKGPMAIVGEGRQAWPEFVIPTDPAYRGRAQGLAAQLLPRLMASGGTLGGDDVVLSSMLNRSALSGLSTGEQQYNVSLAGQIVRSQIAYLNSIGALSTGSSGGSGGGALGSLASVKGSGGSVTSNMALGQAMAAALGWTGQQWTDLNMLITRESGWSNTATNPKSGAFGIGQALPPTKMPLAAQLAGGANARAQIQWTLDYIQGRYGNPAGAWAHETSAGWYARGGVLPIAKYDAGGYLPEGLSLAINGTGSPEHIPGPGGSSSGGYMGPSTVQVVLDGKVVGEAAINYMRRTGARM